MEMAFASMKLIATDDLIGDSPDRLRQVFDTLCQRLEFMCATLEAETDYTQIFRAMWRLSPQFLAAI